MRTTGRIVSGGGVATGASYWTLSTTTGTPSGLWLGLLKSTRVSVIETIAPVEEVISIGLSMVVGAEPKSTGADSATSTERFKSLYPRLIAARFPPEKPWTNPVEAFIRSWPTL